MLALNEEVSKFDSQHHKSRIITIATKMIMEEVCYIFSKKRNIYIFHPDEPKSEFKVNH